MCTPQDPPPCVASSLDDEVDLNAGPKRQRGHRDRRTGGKGLTEILRVDAIHRDEVTHAREIHTGARDIIETLAGRLENRREILQDALRLGRNPPRHQLARRRVLTDLTAEIDETIDFDRLGKRPNRRCEFGRGNCGLAHRKLLALCNGEQTLPQVHYYHYDNAVHARYCYSLRGGFRSTLGDSHVR